MDQKDYYCIEIDLPEAPGGPTKELFMLDTAATSSLLTPKANKRLGGLGWGLFSELMRPNFFACVVIVIFRFVRLCFVFYRLSREILIDRGNNTDGKHL